MGAESDKYKELLKRVGNNEPHYCGRCKRKTDHTMIEEKTGMMTVTHTFKLKCKECGYAENIFCY